MHVCQRLPCQRNRFFSCKVTFQPLRRPLPLQANTTARRPQSVLSIASQDDDQSQSKAKMASLPQMMKTHRPALLRQQQEPGRLVQRPTAVPRGQQQQRTRIPAAMITTTTGLSSTVMPLFRREQQKPKLVRASRGSCLLIFSVRPRQQKIRSISTRRYALASCCITSEPAHRPPGCPY